MFLPMVTVVVPVKNRPHTILAAVTSLLDQDYAGLYEIILVGDRDDPTWTALTHREIRNPRLRIVEVEAPVTLRDANYKRNYGALAGSGEILAFTESDAAVPRTWLRAGVAQLLHIQAHNPDVQSVAGLIDSIGEGFWSRYVDKNIFGAKLPRIHTRYLTTAETFGTGGNKPPASGNLFVTKSAFMSVGGFDELQSRYEDYNFAWRLCSGGHQIFHTPDPAMMVSHRHRAGLGLFREYRHSGRGCGQFIQRCADSPLATLRKRQLRVWQTGVAIVIALLLLAPFTFMPLLVMSALAVAGLASLGGVEAIRLKRFEALIYPALTLILGSVFTFGIATYKDLQEPEINLVARNEEPQWV